MPDDKSILHDHELRIVKLEESQQKIEDTLESMRTALDVSEARAATRSDLMMRQNESLMNQNTRQATQLENVLNIVTASKDKEATRVAELKKMQNDSRMKLFGYFLGGGGLVTIILELIQRALQ